MEATQGSGGWPSAVSDSCPHLLTLRRQSQEQNPVSSTCERLYAAAVLPNPSLHSATLVPPEPGGVESGGEEEESRMCSRPNLQVRRGSKNGMLPSGGVVVGSLGHQCSNSRSMFGPGQTQSTSTRIVVRGMLPNFLNFSPSFWNSCDGA